MKKNIFVCGNSFSNGLYMVKEKMRGEYDYDNLVLEYHKPYINFIAEELNVDYTLLARPIASNYFVCKQIEYAIKHKADLVIASFSSVRHIDFTAPGKRLTDLPTLENLVYEEKTFAPGYKNPTNSSLEEQVVQCLRFPNLERYAKSTNPEYQTIVNYVNEFNDYLLKIDQERLMVLGAINQLRESNTKFIVVDLIGRTDDMSRIKSPKTLADTNVMNVISVDPYVTIPPGFRQQYPNPTDDFHFNQEGNVAVAKLLMPKVKELLGV